MLGLASYGGGVRSSHTRFYDVFWNPWKKSGPAGRNTGQVQPFRGGKKVGQVQPAGGGQVQLDGGGGGQVQLDMSISGGGSCHR